MKHSIASVCLSGDLRQQIESAANAGFAGIEIFENDLLLFDQSPAVVRQIAEDNNIDIIALQPFRDFEGMPAERMRKNFDRAQRKFDVMAELNTNTLLVCSNVSPFAINHFERAIEDFTKLAEMARQRDITLGYEALAWGRFVADYEKAWELVKQVDHPNLGVILDSFHLFSRSANLETIREIPGDKIVLVQIADAPTLDMDVLQWSRHFRCFPGQGDFPLVDFMGAVLKTGYQGYISHEIFNDEFRATPSQTTAVDGKRSLLWLEDEVAQQWPDLAPVPTVKNKPVPPASIKGVEFVEFAVGEEGKGPLVDTLSSLGFTLTSRHRSKEVFLYKLDNICIVINEEPDSFAQNHYLVHGVSVCALAFQTDNAADMAARADYYHYPRVDSRVESAELSIPAIRGLSGELVYFTDDLPNKKRFFDIDFVPVENFVRRTGFTMQIDHITSGLAESEFLSASLFYRVLFGLDVAQPQDLLDPFGLVVSRTATNAAKTIRLPFNMTRSGSASTARFRQQQGGSGVQHIALHCSDLLAYIQTIDTSLLLPIPENYYDDLEARFDLEPAFAEQLRRYQLLYDRNETGWFIHCYTRAINGVFFELVQRHKYGNYGEANAHVRMASQARMAR